MKKFTTKIYLLSEFLKIVDKCCKNIKSMNRDTLSMH